MPTLNALTETRKIEIFLWHTDCLTLRIMRYIAFIVILFLFSTCGTSPSLPAAHVSSPTSISPFPETPNLRIIAIDVGQGDATLVIAPTGESMLIDAGPPNLGKNAIIPLLEALNINELTYIVATHYHEDHIGGILEVVAGRDGIVDTDDDLIPTGGFYDRGEPDEYPNAPSFPLYKSSTANQRHTVYPGQRFNLGDVIVEVMAAGGRLASGATIELGDPQDENAASLALLIEFSGFRMLVAGDITGGGGDPPYLVPDIETPLSPQIGDIDILRVAHHGSKTSTNEAFLKATKPEVAIISLGNRNDYGHPHRATIKRLSDNNIAIYQTERGWLSIDGPQIVDGSIIVEVDDRGSYTVGNI